MSTIYSVVGGSPLLMSEHLRKFYNFRRLIGDSAARRSVRDLPDGWLRKRGSGNSNSMDIIAGASRATRVFHAVAGNSAGLGWHLGQNTRAAGLFAVKFAADANGAAQVAGQKGRLVAGLGTAQRGVVSLRRNDLRQLLGNLG